MLWSRTDSTRVRLRDLCAPWPRSSGTDIGLDAMVAATAPAYTGGGLFTQTVLVLARVEERS